MKLRHFVYLLMFFLLYPPVLTGAEKHTPVVELKNQFEYGNYAKVVNLAEKILDKNKAELKKEELIETYKYLGLSNYIEGKREDAGATFIMLLSIDPSYHLDPLYAPPELISFFMKIKAEIFPNDTQTPDKKPVENNINQRKTGPETKKYYTKYKYYYEKNNYFVNFIPFGAGQFVNGSKVKGSLVLSTQLLALGSNMFFYFSLRAMKDKNGAIDQGKISRAKLYRTMQYVSAGVAAAAYIYGVIDAVVNYKSYHLIRTEESKNFFSVAPYVNGKDRGCAFLLSMKY